MKKFSLAKFYLILTLIFSIISTTVFAVDFGVDNTNDIINTYTDENSSFLKLLSKLGIYTDNYNADSILKQNEANDILKKLFLLENNILTKEDTLTNEVLINAIVNSLGIEKSAKLNKIFTYPDFGYVDVKYRYSYEAYLNNFDFSSKLNPKKEVTQKNFFLILSTHQDSIIKKHGFDILETKVADVSLYNNIKTISLSDRNNIKINKNDKFLFLGDEIETGSKAYVYVKDKNAFAIKCQNITKNYSAGSIYKGTVYLYDRNSNKIILSNIKKYSSSMFKNYIDGFYEFDAFNNVLFYDNFGYIASDTINADYLDKEAVFFTMIDENKNEKICYIVYGGN